MADFSKIQWTTHTFNPWWGCARVSPACRFCYADDLAKRYGHDVWRRKGDRRMLSEANWSKPLKWNRDAEVAGKPAKVFCASMADVFEDHPQLVEPRKRLWDVIERTPWLRWQLLTKRPENVADMVPWGSEWPSWVWLGVSVEDQRRADERIPLLLEQPAAVRFLSCEPLLEQVDLTPYLADYLRVSDPEWDAPDGAVVNGMERSGDQWVRTERLHWIITGGESGGTKARPTELAWIRSLLAQCDRHRVAPFVKQLGTAWARDMCWGGKTVYALGDRKGGDTKYWTTDLRVREFPEAVGVGA